MTDEQLFFIDDLIYRLKSVHLDKCDSYKIITTNKNGKSKRLMNREEYLDYTISEMIEDLEKMFPNIE